MRIVKRLKNMKEHCVRAWEQILFPEFNMLNFRNFDAVALFPSKSLIFNRVKKSGNTALTSFFFSILVQEAKSHEEAKARSQRPYIFGVKSAFVVREYTSFVAVRNPYARILSAYRQKIALSSNARYSRFPGWGEDNIDGFSSFLSYLKESGPYGNRHWWPQCDLLIKPIHQFSFVAKIESIEDELREFLPMIGVDRSVAKRINEFSKTRHATGSVNVMDRFYSRRNRSIVSEIYRKDFDIFEYPL